MMVFRTTLLFLVLLTSATDALAADGPSRGKAFLLSLAVPGLGHRYVESGDWDGAATAFAAADAAMWVGLVSTALRQHHLEDTYRTLAALRADARIAGKDRTFFLTISNYRSAEEFREAQLRERGWDRFDYASTPAFQWEWEREADFQEYRRLREDAESMRRRVPVVAAALVGNRLISGILALRRAGRAQQEDVDVSLGPSSQAPNRLALRLRARF